MLSIYNDLRDAIEGFKEKTLFSIIKGIKSLVKAVEDIKAAIEICEEDIEDRQMIIDKLDEFLNLAWNPIKLVKQIVKNAISYGLDILENVKKMKEAMVNEDYKSAGENLGIVIELTLWGNGTTISFALSPAQSQQFVDGFLIEFY